ncbi:HEAT repeat domain-containing protein [Methanosarcina barkeri]|uniref:HEAT repeat domain-containing protein n=1 Tax=Methanosarcina barkeri TaxID=2208 RepID=UPI000A6DCA37|nr:HEAT repeat domain-containing protein [Methanosarcina barkeri]
MDDNIKNLIKKLERSVFAGNRAIAAEKLGTLGDPYALPALIGALDDSNPKVRTAAAEALGKLNTPEAVPDLINALNDPDSPVKKTAIASLEKNRHT